MKKETEQQRLINDVEDIKRQRRGLMRELTRMVTRAKKTAWIGVALGAIGVTIGAVALAIIYDRGW